MSLKTTAFSIGRRMGKHPVTSRVFCLVERFLPLDRIARSHNCVAFWHPRPSWDPHILVVPTTPFPEIGSAKVSAHQQAALIWEMTNLAAAVANTLDLPADLTMTINGGIRQDIGQVHGHLTGIQPAKMDADTFDLTDPTTASDVWTTLLNAWDKAATKPQNGYSLIVNVHSIDSKTAWLTQTMTEPDQGTANAILEKGRATCA